MEFLADFHIHSRYSRATSKNLNLESLYQSALEKGITVLGTGDFTHPGWMQELRDKLVPAEEGLFQLRRDLAEAVDQQVPAACHGTVRFLLTTEISSIYKKNGQVRKVHNLLFSPSLENALQIAGRLERIGNIASDGRPILGLDSRDLLEIVLESSPLAYLVPAHIWTPWFSVLGSKSGFDSLTECFEDLEPEIFSVETGLSSDPAMNWRLSALDRYTLMSNSDAHSAAKVGREANRFSCELAYLPIKEALRGGKDKGFVGTIEFFPEQGKYHLDGHRKCHCRMYPPETIKADSLCPVCGKGVTVGVMHRVEVLADRAEGEGPASALPYERLISLAEVVSEIKGSGPQTKGVRRICRHLLQQLGPEIFILNQVPLDEITREGGDFLAEGIKRVREAEVFLEEGYDGEFGVVKLFHPEDRARWEGQMILAGMPGPGTKGKVPEKNDNISKKKPMGKNKKGQKKKLITDILKTIPADRAAKETGEECDLFELVEKYPDSSRGWTAERMEKLNPEQREAVFFQGAPLLILAGPGTGKTLTLTHRIAYMIKEQGVPPERILAVTFTLRAAREMEERIHLLLEGSNDKGLVQIKTFHALGVELLRQAGPACGIPADFFIFGADESLRLVRGAIPALSQSKADALLEKISVEKRTLHYPEDGVQGFEDKDFFQAYKKYQQALEEYRALDYDDLVARTVRTLGRHPDFLEAVRQQFSAISVDEYQDVNLAQYRLLRLLADKVEDLCVIGDPDQAIYGFRGASPAYFLEFEKDYPTGKTIRLVRNYRSTETILSASVQMLSACSKDGHQPSLVPMVKDDSKIQMVELASDKAEAIFIAQTIEGLVGGTDSLSFYSEKVPGLDRPGCTGFGDIAVLFRLKALAPALEKALEYQGIPYQSTMQADRWRGREGRSLLALLRWMNDPEDRMALEQLQAGCKKGSSGDIPARMEQYRKKQILKKCSLQEWIQGFGELEFLPLEEEETWKEVWETLLRASISFGRDWDSFLRSLTLSGEADLLERKVERVTLSTLHAAKGLEFPVVFIVSCEDQLLPCRVGHEPMDSGEEQRLFYVGMTRACRRLYLTHVRSRFLYGERRSGIPSPFLKDIPQEKVEKVCLSKKEGKKRAREDSQPMLFKLT